ncbi:cytochrome P450 2J4-like [Amphiura filiformis]|uniref:cytochrome P450 2J4-like n=1 Tax=Amphiura filiformis TaxID=82378 RepID=UPI003B214463
MLTVQSVDDLVNQFSEHTELPKLLYWKLINIATCLFPNTIWLFAVKMIGLPEKVLGFGIETILLCIAAFAIVSWWLQKPKNLPPGPWGWPLVGYLPNLVVSLYRTGLNPHQLFANMATKYGPIFSMRIGGRLVVVLNKHRLIKEAFHNPHISNRPASQTMVDLGLASGGGFLSPGEGWKHERRFTLTTLRSFGVGKRSFEECIAEEADYLSEEITHFNATSFNPQPLFTNATSNIICSVVFGKRYGYSDSNFKYLLSLINQNVQLFGAGGVQLFFPIAKYFQPNHYKQLKNNITSLIKFINDVVKQHESDRDPDNPNDYIDVYLNEIESSQKLGQESQVKIKTMPITIMGLFGAGTETTSTTLRWGVKYMMAYPEIQKRIQQEIDSVVGRDRRPRLSDKDSLPFTAATLLEIQRISSIVPLGVFHNCGEDTTIDGYTIPKETLVLANLSLVHHNPDTWKNPDEFNPERFLDKDGCLMEREKLIPFSTGRRMCIGEHLAKMELYIFFTHLFHRFTFKKPDGDSQPISLKGVVGFVNAPSTFLTQVESRD